MDFYFKSFFFVLECFSTGFLKISFVAQTSLSPIGSVLKYPLLNINGQEVTFGKILVSLIFLTAGIILSKTIIKIISQKLLYKVIDNESAVYAIENLTFYVLVIFFFLVALQVANIPITVFTYAAGAAAIAIGLGSQKIVYNFISGIIILIEQPIKKGDYVRVGDVFGKIEEVGTRATKINSANNKHLILPNSRMIEENIENLTHHNRKIKAQVKVGVQYGSDINLVKRLLIESSKENIATLKSSEPIVLFEKFGENSLDFTLLFDVTLNNFLDERRITSKVREAIDAKFKKHEVVIAYPQRDVHVHLPKEIKESFKKKLA